MMTQRIMVVDDDSDDIELFIEAVKDIDPGMNCQSALNGMEALSLLESAVVKPDIIFVDMNMPILNGRDFIKTIRQNNIYSKVKLILYSTVDLNKNLQNLEMIGADGFFRKPISYTALRNGLSEIIHSCFMDHSV